MEKNKSTVFDLDVENIPDDWGIVSLKAIDLGGKENIDPRAYPGDDFEYYSIPAYKEGGNPVIEKGKNILSQKILVQNDSVLFGKLNPRVEKVWHVQSESGYKKIASTEFIPIYPDQKKIFPRYLYYVEWSKFVMPKAKTLVTGSTPSRQRVDPASFFKIKIPLPPRIEQVRIAFILSNLQQIIDQQEKIIVKTKELKRSLMQKLFTEGLRGEEIKETEIGLMPESWNVISIGDAYEFTTKPRGLDLSEYEELPFIPMELISENQRLLQKYEMRKSFSSGTYVQKGDLVVAKITPSFENGKQGIVTDIPFDFCYATTEVWPLHGINDRSNINYLHYYLKKPDVRNEIAGKMEGSTGRQRVPKSVIAETKIPLPSYEEQLEINDIFISLDQKIEMNGSKMKNLQVLFKSMLQLLMTGQVRVKDIDLEGVARE